MRCCERRVGGGPKKGVLRFRVTGPPRGVQLGDLWRFWANLGVFSFVGCRFVTVIFWAVARSGWSQFNPLGAYSRTWDRNHRDRLEKLLCVEVSKNPNGHLGRWRFHF